MKIDPELIPLFEYMEDYDNDDLGILGKAYKLIDIAYEYMQSNPYIKSKLTGASQALYFYNEWQKQKLEE